MPGKCKFQDAWLDKDIYRDWLMRDVHDIHSARCLACNRFIKLQTMGEAALTSHAGGAGHQVAVRKLLQAAQALYRPQNSPNFTNSPGGERSIHLHLPCESNSQSIDATRQVNGGMAQVKGMFWAEEETKRLGHSQQIVVKSEVQDPSPESPKWSEVNHKNSTSHDSEQQQQQQQHPAFRTTFITATGCATKRPSRRGRPPSKSDISDSIAVLEQQRNMALLEWEGRMKNLSQEQELLVEKRRATRQKERAYRLKKRYYRAKLRQLGEDAPSSADSEPEERLSVTGHEGIL